MLSLLGVYRINGILHHATIVFYPENKEQVKALKAIAKALKVRFEIGVAPYNSVFVDEVNKSEEARMAGKKGLRVNVENL
jgi:hypothetical protein